MSHVRKFAVLGHCAKVATLTVSLSHKLRFACRSVIQTRSGWIKNKITSMRNGRGGKTHVTTRRCVSVVRHAKLQQANWSVRPRANWCCTPHHQQHQQHQGSVALRPGSSCCKRNETIPWRVSSATTPVVFDNHTENSAARIRTTKASGPPGVQKQPPCTEHACGAFLACSSAQKCAVLNRFMQS